MKGGDEIMRSMLSRRENRNMFDDLFSFPSFHDFDSNMRTDVKEKDGNYLIDIDLPGFSKEDISLSLEDGYLEVKAEHASSNDEKDDDGTYLCRERYYGSMTRSFYVGKDVHENDIKASYQHGTLSLLVPNKDNVIENKKVIPIDYKE